MVARLMEAFNRHPNITMDVGQVLFGQTVTLSGDVMAQFDRRYDASPQKWNVWHAENEGSGGIVPYHYKTAGFVNGLQWAIGLELFLMSDDPWRMALSTDHPNGGSFENYPKLIRLLMDKQFRKDQAALVNQKAVNSTSLLDIDREFTMQEIAVVTRAGPAKLLGLTDKGHLGVGADADITIYDEMEDKEAMFNAARYVVKSGELFINNHEFCSDYEGRILHVAPEYDLDIETKLKPFFEDYYSIQFENYAVGDQYLHGAETVPTMRKN